MNIKDYELTVTSNDPEVILILTYRGNKNITINKDGKITLVPIAVIEKFMELINEN